MFYRRSVHNINSALSLLPLDRRLSSNRAIDFSIALPVQLHELPNDYSPRRLNIFIILIILGCSLGANTAGCSVACYFPYCRIRSVGFFSGWRCGIFYEYTASRSVFKYFNISFKTKILSASFRLYLRSLLPEVKPATIKCAGITSVHSSRSIKE